MKITTKKVLKYTLLPGFVPMLRELMGTGFGYVSFFMAQIYRAARLLPVNHPYLNAQNIGKFGIRHVVAAAAGQLRFRKENIDQIVIFTLMLASLVILAMQFFMLGLAFFVHTAHAASGSMPTNFTGFFVTASPHDDIAFVLLDRVFGIPKMFNSCVATNDGCFQNILHENPVVTDGPFPWPVHLALQGMFQLYSTGLLIIAVIIFLYFIVAVAVETAQTGTPFGKRFNKVWAPIRMVVALGLLIPLSSGMNSAQYIVLYAAKYGSGFATNGWNLFIAKAVSASETLAGTPSTLVATPNAPDLTNLLEFATVMQTCKALYGTAKPINAYLVTGGDQPASRQVLSADPDQGYNAAVKFYNNHDILVRFGTCLQQTGNAAAANCASGTTMVYNTEAGGVAPLCGEITLKTAAPYDPNNTASVTNNGAFDVQKNYFQLIQEIWFGKSIVGNGGCADSGGDTTLQKFKTWGTEFFQRYGQIPEVTGGDFPAYNHDVTDMITAYKAKMACIIKAAVQDQQQASEWTQQLDALGWAGAGIWYNKIAQLNGSIISAVQSLPNVRHYPKIMEDVQKERAAAMSDTSGRNGFQPVLSNNKKMQLPDGETILQANTLWQAYSLWSDAYPKPTNNIFVDIMRIIFGDNGLLSLQDPANANVHPLVLLSGLGKSLVEKAIFGLGSSAAAGLGGGIAAVFGQTTFGQVSGFASGVLQSLGMITLTAGFILFYVVPFMPFVYFFFAVGNWIKGIFEAMVGVPLWALAHIRIDGEGLAGQAALSGYFMILEIFLRPILIVFGLLAGITIFSAQVRVLNDIWGLVTSNLTGFDVDAATNTAGTAGTQSSVAGNILGNLRDVVDQFFFTVIYAIVVYMLGMASFKLVNLIPQQIMRWLGQSANAFDDGSQDDAAGLVTKISEGSQLMGGASKGLQDSMQSVRSGADAHHNAKKSQ